MYIYILYIYVCMYIHSFSYELCWVDRVFVGRFRIWTYWFGVLSFGFDGKLFRVLGF